MDPKRLPIMNPNSFKHRFARNFIRSLMRIQRQNRLASLSSSPREILRQYHRVKVAANKSLALAAGSGRFWSKVMLLRSKNPNRRKGFSKRFKTEVFLSRKYSKEIKSVIRKKKNKKKKKKEDDRDEGLNGEVTSELRKHIPGGGAMDLCLLLKETEHYIKCLNTQVEVMRNIVDYFLL